MSNDKEIIIDLKESLNPETFNKASNILQKDAFSRLTEIVEEHSPNPTNRTKIIQKPKKP